MAYTVLARRYRSGTFDEVVGQEHVAQTLKKAIASDRVAHAYLFNGTRGVGKTSMARILAKALNCQAGDKPTTEPCGQCTSCLAIARGDDMDVIEIDAASNTQVDKTREVVIDNAAYRPAHSRFKIYIIDEVHMLSKSSFNALLKTLEEPPSHVKFILATTEPEKIPNTILSRCQRYDFRNIPTREIAGHLKVICEQEKIQADEDALLLVAKAGAGSMRDALSLLDRLLSIGEKQLTVEMIEQLLGLPKSQLIFDLAQAIGAGDVKATLTQASRMVQAGLSVDSLIVALVDHLRNLLIIRTCGMDSELVEVPGLAPAELQAQAEQFDPVALTQDITILEELRRQVRQSQAGRALLDATLVRMALSDQFASIGDLLGRLNGSPSAPPAPRGSSIPTKKKADVGATTASLAPANSASISVGTTPASLAPAFSAASPPPDDTDGDDDLPRPGKVWDAPKVSLATLLKQHAQQTASAPPAPPLAPVPVPANGDDLQHTWAALLEQLSEQVPMLHGMLSLGQLVAIEEGQAVIRYGSQHESLVRMFDRNGKKEQVRDALGKVLNQSIGVKFEIAAEEEEASAVAPTPSPPAFSSPRLPGRAPAPAAPSAPAVPSVRVTTEMVDALRESQPLIRALMDTLSAQIIKIE